ncbi:MAG: hypothetical protein LBP26_06815 [Clostridiales bacterium]|jgi:DNA repair protein RadC|nr:hypothetical protein [Clostridiales bacterium]
MDGGAEKAAERENVHAGHRERVRGAVDTDPDFTTFSEHEVLEYLLFTTIPRIDTNVLAHKLIDAFGSLSGVLNANPAELVRFAGVSQTTARMLTAVIPAARKAEISRLKNNVFLDSHEAAAAYMHAFFANRNTELLYLACLDVNDRLLNMGLITSGATHYTAFDVKKIVESSCRHGASKIILAHNHPAGSLAPSSADEFVTAKAAVALSAMGILLADHIIFTSDGYYSFYMHGKIAGAYSMCDRILGTAYMNEIRERKQSARSGKYIRETSDPKNSGQV